MNFQDQIKNALEHSNLDEFNINEYQMFGENIVLCSPKNMGVSWNEQNLILRSVVYRKEDFFPISLSFKKFFNWGEQPTLSEVPRSLNNSTIVEKLDGSTCIVSKYKEKFILRTRGTVDAFNLDNGHELELLKTKYPNVYSPTNITKFVDEETWDFSLLFEWVSPLQRIVINYGDEPDWYLVGMVRHTDYSLATQDQLDYIAKVNNFKRPLTYTFNNIVEMLMEIENWKGKEGVVVYSSGGQTLHKCKAAHYLMLHRLKSELSSTEKVIDVWLSQGRPSYNVYFDYLATTFDFELANQVRGTISNVCDAYKEVNNIIDGMHRFVEKVKNMSSRKEQAVSIISSYGKETNRSGFVFKILDGKDLRLDDDAIKKLLFQVLKNERR